MQKITLKQVELKRLTDGNQVETLVCWVDASNLQERYRVGLEGEKGWWTVNKIYDHGINKAELHTDRESHVIHEKDHHRKMEGLKLGEVIKP